MKYGKYERRIEMGHRVQVIRRLDFDADLVAQARERGIEVIEGEGIVSYETNSQSVVVRTTEGRELVTKVLVGADGAASVVRKQILHNKKETPHRLFMMELQVPMPQGYESTMIYDFTMMNRGLKGYIWLFPAPGNRLNVGIMHYPAKKSNLSGRELSAMLREGLAPFGVQLPKKGVRGWPVWGYHPRATISEERVLTVGDAAGIDGLTGEGIAVAMEQAIVAGDVIHQALTTEKYSFSSYRKKIRKAIVGQELSLDRWLSKLVYGSKQWRDWLALVLLDEKVVEMYARRVDGTEVLAHQKLKLYGALIRHTLRYKSRQAHMRDYVAQLPAPK